jgi:hypothetical protein
MFYEKKTSCETVTLINNSSCPVARDKVFLDQQRDVVVVS